MIIFAIGVIILLVLLYLWSQKMPKNFPPGPWGFPIVGHIPLLDNDPAKTAIKWKKPYGPVVGIKFASYNCVIMSDCKVIKDTYNLETCLDRPLFKVFSLRNGGGPCTGIAFSVGRLWREQRAFIFKQFRRQGYGTRSMETHIWAQVAELVEGIKKEVGRPVATHTRFNTAFWNVIWALIAGDCFKQTDPRVVEMAEFMVNSLTEFDIFTMASMFFPWWADNGPENLTHIKLAGSVFGDSVLLFKPFIDEHWRTHVPNDPRDYIDAYIDEIKRTKDPESTFYGEKGRIALYMTIMDMFVAGTETTANTFKWINLILAVNPDAQEKLAEEVLRVVGPARGVTLADRPNMPYTEAVLYETMRYRTLVGFGVCHFTCEDVKIAGYDVPKNTVLFANMYEANNNKEYWGDPENWRPERWIGSDGKFIKHENWIPFGAGKRYCLGMQLSKDELFMMTAGFVQTLRISLVPGQPAPRMDPRPGGSTLGPWPYEILYNIRD